MAKRHSGHRGQGLRPTPQSAGYELASQQEEVLNQGLLLGDEDEEEDEDFEVASGGQGASLRLKAVSEEDETSLA